MDWRYHIRVVRELTNGASQDLRKGAAIQILTQNAEAELKGMQLPYLRDEVVKAVAFLSVKEGYGLPDASVAEPDSKTSIFGARGLAGKFRTRPAF